MWEKYLIYIHLLHLMTSSRSRSAFVARRPWSKLWVVESRYQHFPAATLGSVQQHTLEALD